LKCIAAASGARPAFYIAVVPDMVGGRLSSHDRDLLGLAHNWRQRRRGAGGGVRRAQGKRFATAGVDRLLVLEARLCTGASIGPAGCG
jgi:electron transfer flavoprotein alpha subunit